MQLRPGARVSHYEIGALLGAGGMGEVYRARDLTLNRDVALKVIGGAGLADLSALARFEREAHLLASLNHPHVASIFGFVNEGGVRAIAMEIVEGPTLADRLAGGPLPVRDALAIADQIADALEAAHDKGIVHRDLKPANVKFTAGGAVKVLDFGIAKSIAAVAVSQASTIEATREGTVVGTAAYMSPEQARGLAVDGRADVWAFGVMLFEMLSGRRPFEGPTVSDVVAAVLTRDPDWTALPAAVPSAIVRLLQGCLERDPARRLRQIGTARYAIGDAAAAPAASTAARRSRVTVVLAALALATFIIQIAIVVRGDKAPQANAAILSMSEPPGEPLYLFAGPIALSPDGTRVALVTNSAAGKPHLWLRAMTSTTPQLLHGADGGTNPFWSPDGRSLGFFADGQLKVIDLVSGDVRTVASWAPPTGGGVWTKDGVIVFSQRGGLRRVAAAGGPVTAVTAEDAGGTFYSAPYVLPDARHVLYYARSLKDDRGAVMIASIDGGEPRRLMDSLSAVVYAPQGYLLYQRAGEVVAQAFDARSLSTRGDPVPLVADAWAWSTAGMMALSVSDTGVLLFAARRPILSQLTWFDRTGRPTGTVAEIGEWVHLALSPDERMLAAERLDQRTGFGTIWTVDLARNMASRLTPEPSWSLAPIWSPDGSAIAYGASRQGASDIYARSSDGNGPEKPLYVSPHLKIATDWTRDGRIIFNMVDANGIDIMMLPAAGGGQPAPLLKTAANEGGGRISPDGLWLAYTSNESGRNEVYVRAVSGRGRWPISSAGGGQPRWRRDGRELYYVNPDGGLMAVSVSGGAGAFTAASPEALPIRSQPDVTEWRMSYDATSDGKHFVASVPAGGGNAPPIVAVPYWPALLRRP